MKVREREIGRGRVKFKKIIIIMDTESKLVIFKIIVWYK